MTTEAKPYTKEEVQVLEDHGDAPEYDRVRATVAERDELLAVAEETLAAEPDCDCPACGRLRAAIAKARGGR